MTNVGDLDGDGTPELAIIEWRRQVPCAQELRVLTLEGKQLFSRVGVHSLQRFEGAPKPLLLATRGTWTPRMLIEWGTELGEHVDIVEVRR